MSEKKFPPGGALFTNTFKKSESHPDFKGSLELSTEVLKSLLEQAKAGDPIKMDLGAWKKQGAKGGFLSLKASPLYVKAETARPNPSDFSDDIPF